MIWLTWRQHRKQAIFTIIGLAVLAAFMIPTGLMMHHTYDHLGIPECLRKLGNAEMVSDQSDSCDGLFGRFTGQYTGLGNVGVLFIFLPLLVGLFWGAPLVAREVEHGTHRLVWTQSVSRQRWAWTKITLIGSATLGLAAVYGLGMSWWFGPLSQTIGDGRFGGTAFDLQGVAPIGYTLFAVALGVCVGTIWQKTLPAMAFTLVGFVAVRIGVESLARKHYLPARTLHYSLASALQPNRARGDWVESLGIRNAAGKMVAPHAQVGCPPSGAPGADNVCGARLGFGPGAYNWQLYQPANRFWLFQGIESGIFVVLAAALVAFAVHRIRRIA